VIAGCAALAATLTLAAPAQAAPTLSSTDLFEMTFLGDVSDLAVTNTRVFATHNNRGGIAVTNAAGTLETTIDGLAGPSGLTLSPDRRTLYVALSSGAAIASYDTTTLQLIATYPVGAGLCPQTLAVTGRWLWFGEACEPLMGQGRLGRVDLTTGAAAIDVLAPVAGSEGAPKLAVAAGGVLLVGQPAYADGEYAPRLSSYLAGANGALYRIGTLAGSASDRAWRGELAVSPDGRTLYLAGAEALLAVNPVLLGRPLRRYPQFRQTFLTGVGPSGAQVATVGDADGDMTYTVSLLSPSGAVTEVAYLDPINEGLAHGRLVWSPDASRLYFLGTRDSQLVLFTVSLS
jgi:hypothetical protein